jgi:predicted nuclease of predicted toxin-antitoxin system
VRLLLDEQFSHRIAEALRANGHDVRATGELGLNGAPDEELLVIALDQGRVLVTNNVADFVPIEREWAAGGDVHQGIIYASDGSVPRAVNQMGELLTRLARVLGEYPDADALRGRSIFLSG